VRQQVAALAREESRLATKDERATEYHERQSAATEQRRTAQAAKLGGLADVQTLRDLWHSADSAASFLTASQAQGFTVARVTAQDARDSRADAEATAGRDPSRSAPIYSKAELVAYNAQGFGFRLDGATLDDANHRVFARPQGGMGANRGLRPLRAQRRAGAFRTLAAVTPAPARAVFAVAAIEATRHAKPRRRRSIRKRFADAGRYTTRQTARKSASLSLRQLRAWHAQRGTLSLFYAMYPDEAPRR
jgi:hypothetical protein